MSVQKPDYTRGILVPEAALAVGSSDAATSSVSSAGGRAGEVASTSRMRLVATGEPVGGRTLTLTALQGGHAIPGVAPRFEWHDDAEDRDRGWLPYNVATGFFFLASAGNLDSGTYPGIGTATYPAALTLQSGDVIFAFVNTYLGDDYIGVARYDSSVGGYAPSYAKFSGTYTYPDRGAWSWVYDAVDPVDTGTPTAPALLELPDGRILLFFVTTQYYQATGYYCVGMAFSDDSGATWILGTVDTGARVGTGSAPYRLQAVYSGGYVTLIFSLDGGGFSHWYSSDLGSTFAEVVDSLGGSAFSQQLVVGVDGTIALLFVGGDNLIKIARSAGYAAGFSDEESISPTGASDTTYTAGPDALACTVLEDGSIAVAAVTEDTGATAPRLKIWRFKFDCSSVTDAIQFPIPGYDWEAEAVDYGAGTGATQRIPVARSLCRWGASLLLAGDQSFASPESCCWLFGGYSSISWNNLTFGYQSGPSLADRFGAWWDAAYLPSGIALWTVAGAGMEVRSVDWYLKLDFSGGASSRSYSRTGTSGAGAVAWLRVRVDSGGSLAADFVGAKLVSSDGTNEYNASLRLTTTSIRVYDNIGAATKGTDATGLTSGEVRDYLFSLTGTGRVVVWYKAATSQIWIQGPTGNCTAKTIGPAATSAVYWGCITASTSFSTWIHVGTCCDEYVTAPVAITEPNQPRIAWGREISVFPSYVSDGISVSALSGPAFTGDTWTVAPEYDYASSLLDPLETPSPSQAWRSTSDADEQVIGWDLSDADGPDSAMIGLYLRGANFTEAILEVDDGGGWDLVATMATTTLSGADFVRTGRTLKPGSSATTGTRSFARDELAGSWAILSNAGDHYIKIRRNSQGTWNASTGILACTLTIDGDLAGLPTSGTIAIIAPECTLIAKNPGPVALWRVRIPARSYTSAPEDYHTAAILFIGAYFPFGWQWSNAPTKSATAIQRIDETEDGRRSVARLNSTLRRAWEWVWTDPIPGMAVEGGTLGDAATPDTLSACADETPAAHAYDPQQVEEVFRRIGGAFIPVVGLTAVPQVGDSPVTVYGRDLQLYGRVVSDSTTRTIPVAAEGSVEVTTIAALRIEEEL